MGRGARAASVLAFNMPYDPVVRACTTKARLGRVSTSTCWVRAPRLGPRSGLHVSRKHGREDDPLRGRLDHGQLVGLLRVHAASAGAVCGA